MGEVGALRVLRSSRPPVKKWQTRENAPLASELVAVLQGWGGPIVQYQGYSRHFAWSNLGGRLLLVAGDSIH